ncbi:MAG TPA: non-homologous end-joining DNA ligase [Polyangiales bacterium]|nr:non-homologous end-joining DNA ligase [Polyangiales bacterium]
MPDVLEGLSEELQSKIERRAQPKWTQPMLATLTDDRFSDPDWIYERKLDGVRCLVFSKNGRIRLMSRNEREMNETWPDLVEELEENQEQSFIADGEIVAFEGNKTSFSRLQQRIGVEEASKARKTRVRAYLYLFDLLHVEQHDITKLPLRQRKQLLKETVSFSGHVRYTPHRNEDGEAYLKEACRKGWEGLIAKDARAAYEHKRSKKWLKFKCVHQQELVIGGFTDPQGSRVGFGALLTGYYEDGELRYSGKVGTGYDDELLKSLRKRLDRLERKTSPFDEDVSEKNVHWVTPELVGEFGFTEWTRKGRLRHPRFLGLRKDKDAKDVHRERAGG